MWFDLVAQDVRKVALLAWITSAVETRRTWRGAPPYAVRLTYAACLNCSGTWSMQLASPFLSSHPRCGSVDR